MSDEKENIDPLLEKQWEEWSVANPVSKMEAPSDEELKEALIRDLSLVSKMSVEEYTLFQKYNEIQDRYPSSEISTIFGNEIVMDNSDDRDLINQIKENVWIPNDVDDFMNLKPELIYTPDYKLTEYWNCIRDITHTMKNNSNIGRNLNFLVRDKITSKDLGLICISSDFLDLTPRDKFIGWDRTFKTQGHMINYTAIGSTILPLQPFGYNYVGGKLLALLCLSDEVQYQWKKQYGNTLVGVTTTSLYGKNKAGGVSQYNGLDHWIPMGFSSGSVSYEASKKTIKMLRDWLKKNYTRKYFEWYFAKKPSGQPYKRDHRNRSYNFVYTKLDIPKEIIRSEHQRGIYFSPLYDNTNDFLCGKIQEKDLKKSFPTDYDSLVNIWKTKHAKSRVRILQKKNKLLTDTLFYDNLSKMTWEESREQYLSQVGR